MSEKGKIPKHTAWKIIIFSNLIGIILTGTMAYFYFSMKSKKNNQLNIKNYYEDNIQVQNEKNYDNSNLKKSNTKGLKKDRQFIDIDDETFIYNKENSIMNKNNSIEENTTLELESNVTKTKDIYDVIKEGLLSVKEEMNISRFDKANSTDEVFKVIQKVVNENPEILYYEGGEYWTNGILKPKFSKDKDTILLHQSKMRSKRDEIISKIITRDMSEYDKVKAIHDYIIINTVYDNENYERGTVPIESYSAYGVLVNGVGVCEGYAKAMKYILDELGIENIIVSGIGKGENHAWNIVKINGQYYHIDITWNDPVMDDGSNVIRYDYFNLTDEEMMKEHSWNREEYPRCLSIKYNYYYLNNLVIHSYDEFYKIIKKSISEGQKYLELKILNYNNKIYNVQSTINKAVNDINQKIYFNNYKYSINEKLGIIKIEFL